MARRAQDTTTALVNWEDEMAKQAKVAAGMEANTGGGGSFFSIAGGILSFDGAPIPGNQMGVVILDAILENVFYEGVYDPGNPAPPTCFAHARDEVDMAPHDTVVEAGQAQNETCEGCPKNEWGSAERGRGKACRNTRRLAIIPAGTIDNDDRFTAFDDAEDFLDTKVGFLKVPVTSVRGYATYVKKVAGALERPPHCVFTRIRLVPDPRTQFMLLFEALDSAPRDIIPTLMKRHAEMRDVIAFPYPLTYDDQRQKIPQRKAKY